MSDFASDWLSNFPTQQVKIWLIQWHLVLWMKSFWRLALRSISKTAMASWPFCFFLLQLIWTLNTKSLLYDCYWKPNANVNVHVGDTTALFLVCKNAILDKIFHMIVASEADLTLTQLTAVWMHCICVSIKELHLGKYKSFWNMESMSMARLTVAKHHCFRQWHWVIPS